MCAEPGSWSTVERFETVASVFGGEIERVGVESADAAGIDRVLVALRGVQARVASAVVRIALRADALAAEGVGAPARDALLGAGQVRGSTARREAARAGLAARSADLEAAMGSGRLGSDHLDALVRRLGRLDDEHLGRVEVGALLRRADALPTDTFDAALRRAVEEAATSADGPHENDGARTNGEVRHWFNHRTGMGHLSGQLDPERYEAMVAALDHHTAALANDRGDGTVRNAALAAEALVDLICGSGERSAHLPHVTVIVDEATLRDGRHADTVAETQGGHGLSDRALARLCCDAVLRRVMLDDRGVPIDVGRRHRTATDAQWAALRAVHPSCAWAGCDRPLSQCQAHHIRYWRHGGRTDLDNLVPLCPHHHHLVHDGRWRIELLADRSLRITRPDGQAHRITEPPTRRRGRARPIPTEPRGPV